MDSHKKIFFPDSDSDNIEQIDDGCISERQIDGTSESDRNNEYDDNEDLLIDDTGVVVEENANRRWESGKTVSEMEEDLLNYDSDNDMDIQEEGDNSNLRQIANELLQKPVNKVLINFNNDTFLLFDYLKNRNFKNINKENSKSSVSSESSASSVNPTNNADSSYPIICPNSDVNSHPSNVLMTIIRHFLEDYYGKLKFATKEILLNIPSLDIILYEDNIYNNQITFEDIQTVFRILKARSKQNNEDNIPEFLIGNIELRPRFVARYNTLVELTESSATLQNIRPFSNDKSHPLILEDNVADISEPVVLNIDDEEEEQEKEKEKVLLEEDVESSGKGLGDEETRAWIIQTNDNEGMQLSNKKNVGYNNTNNTNDGDDDDLLEVVSDIEKFN